MATGILTPTIEAKLELAARRAERGWDPIVSVDVWERRGPDERAPHEYLVRSRWKSVQEVREELLCHLGAERDEFGFVSDDAICKSPEDGGFGIEGLTNFAWVEAGYKGFIGDVLWPKGRIQVYSLRGSSEGDWVHVDVHDGDTEKTRCVLLAKTFSGRDAAWRFARAIADLLGV